MSVRSWSFIYISNGFLLSVAPVLIIQVLNTLIQNLICCCCRSTLEGVKNLRLVALPLLLKAHQLGDSSAEMGGRGKEGHGFSNLLGPRNQGFWSKINCSQMKLLYFVNWHSIGPTKIGHYFRKETVWKLELEKRLFTNKWSSKFIFFFRFHYVLA